MYRKTLSDILSKPELLVIGLMSGTSADGMDAALVRISGTGTALKASLVSFLTLPYTGQERDEILRLASGSSGGSRE